jgi:hypothetical protein
MAVDNDLNDPEDAYDATDPPGERLLNFIRRLAYIADRLDIDTPPRLAIFGRVNRLVDDLDTLRIELGD